MKNKQKEWHPATKPLKKKKILKCKGYDNCSTVQSISLYKPILVKILNFFDKISLH